jgi:osmotically-inducible protein OsmY
MNNKAAIIGGVGLGAALMYFFDPDRGARRRALVRDKCESAANKTGTYAEKFSRDLRNRASGVVADAKSLFRKEDVSDDVLVDRVRAKLGHYSEHTSAIDVSAQNGVVTLRGPILAQEVPHVLSTARLVRGVTDIDNQLEVRGQAGDNASLQGTPAPLGSEPALAGGI